MVGDGRRSARKEVATIAEEFDPDSETLDDDYAAFRKRAKQMPEAERKAIDAKFDAAFAKRRDAHRRTVNNIFLFWFVCGEKACKRVSRCAGDPEACFERWWPVVPERNKVQFRSFIKARNAGLSQADALRKANAEVESAAEHIARVDAETLADLRAKEAAVQALQIPIQSLAEETPHPASRTSSAQPLPDQVGDRLSPRSAGRGQERAPRVRVL